MAVTSTDAKEQSSLAKTVREVAAREVIVEGKCTMDLLHGLLCFIGWGHFRFSMGSLLTILSQLCTALTVDLQLRSRHCGEGNLIHMFPRPIASQIQGATGRFQPRSIVIARTALACYFLTSCVATFQTVGDSLAWSPYLEECLKMIQCSRGVRGDELLVQMIKLQRITSKVTDVRIQLRDTDSEQSTRLIHPYIFSLNTQLSETRKQLPPQLTTNKMLEAMSLHTEICINDLIFTRLGHCPLLDDINSMEVLLNCLNAAKRAVDIMFNFKPTEYTYFPFFLWRQFRTVILTLIRLASFEDPAWDVNMVRRTVDITSILDKTAENLSNVQTNVDDDITDHENVVSKSLAWVNKMRSCLLAVYGQSTDAQAPTSEIQSSMGIPGVETLLPRQPSQEEASTIDIFSSLDNELFGDDVFEWWPPLYSGNGL
ncbi:fungal specific transcription factor domain-containing protein [Aspergillus tubingensis]|nr:nuclear condensing complex subunit, C-term domain family protein [Aspergillus tubingensis]GFN14841.1 nuclear condensing complex subunit, C-term domain family protein [Aspergillus tubingensis]